MAFEVLGDQHRLASLHRTQLLDSVSDMQRQYNAGKQLNKKLKRTKDALFHETNVIDEMGDEWEPSTGGHVEKWMKERKKMLERKVSVLQSYVKNESKKYVKRRYVNGWDCGWL